MARTAARLLPTLFLALLGSSPLQATVGEAFDPAAHPDFFLVDGILDQVPVKNQASSPAWVKTLNETYGVSFTHVPIPRSSSFKCLSYAISTCADWWRLQLRSFDPDETYRSLTHGGCERGINPREIEAQYYARSGNDEKGFFLLPYPAMDSLTHERIPYNLEAYARLVCDPQDPACYPDPALGGAWCVHEGKTDYGMDRRYLTLWKANVVGNGKSYAEILKRALLDHGICYGGVEFTFPFGLSVHVVTIVGFGEIEGETWFVYRESFGDGVTGPDTGEPLYRMCKVGRINEAYTFPHLLRHSVAAVPGGFELRITDGRGGPVDVDRLVVETPGTDEGVGHRRVGTGRYLFVAPGDATAWRAEVRFGKRYFAPAPGGEYRLLLRFRGDLSVEDATRDTVAPVVHERW